MKVYQFSFKRHGRPKSLPVLDARRLPNRMSVAAARSLPGFKALVAEGIAMLRQHGEIAVGCLYGRHRSVAVAQEIVNQVAGATLHRADQGRIQ